MSYAGRRVYVLTHRSTYVCVCVCMCLVQTSAGPWEGKKDSARSRLQVITFNFYFRVFASWTKFNFTTKYAFNAVAFSFFPAFFFIFAPRACTRALLCVCVDFSRDSKVGFDGIALLLKCARIDFFFVFPILGN